MSERGKPIPVIAGSTRVETDVTNPAVRPIPPVPSRFDAVVDRWFVETFHNIGLQTELFNRFRAAADALKREIAALTSK